MLHFLRNQWSLLSGIGVWIGTILAGFFREPPPATAYAATNIGSFGQFFLTLAIGLMLIPIHRCRQKSAWIIWLVIALALLCLTPVAYFRYEHLSLAWTCTYANSRIVVGGDDGLTEHGKKFQLKFPDKTCADVIWDHDGVVEEIWTKESIEARLLRLSVLYVLALPLFAASMICVIQAFYCA